MKSMIRLGLCLFVFVAVGLGASRLSSRESSKTSPQKAAVQKPAGQKAASSAGEPGNVERGRYLVENVAMCEECHTPRDSRGNLDESRRLQGAAIWITPVHHTTNWAMHAPGLAGFEQFTDEQGEQILEQGVGPNGLPIQPPMHIYHMSHADAQAVIAYLRSLPGDYPRR
ncbi:MAG TPA: c-type cytochrome [Candidatus Acidoferrales bacterium]